MTNNISNYLDTRTRIYLHGEFRSDREKELKKVISLRLEEKGFLVESNPDLENFPLDLDSVTDGIEREARRFASHQKFVIQSDIKISLLGDDSSNRFRNEVAELQNNANITPTKFIMVVEDSKQSANEDVNSLGNHQGYYVFLSFNLSTKEVASGVVEKVEILLQQERDVENRKAHRIQLTELKESVNKYVEPTLDGLKSDKSRYQLLAFWFYLATAGFLIVGLLYTFYVVRVTFVISQSEWIKLCIIGVKTTFVLAVLFACSRYTFHMGSSFMNEALRSADRIHALRFGELYLNIYGNKAEWSDIKEAFQDWNIDRTSPFASMNADSYDPKLLEKLVDLAKTAVDKGK